jgi:phytanoyl-CoA hydroxylase
MISTQDINNYFENGYLIFRNLFDSNKIQNIYSQAYNIYLKQMINLNLINNNKINNHIFEYKMKILFETHNDTFINCGKQCQHIIDLWRLSLDKKIIDTIKVLGVENPIVCTRPVLFSNSKHISKSDINHSVPAHQDWASMQGSINSIVCWIPLIDIDQELGAISFVPKSHKLGLLSKKKNSGFGLVDKFSENDFISVNVNQGDAIFFSSFLVHKSGNNVTNHIRWSTHFRYNDLNEKTFTNRGFPCPYIYKPIDEIIHPDFDTENETKNYFGNT